MTQEITDNYADIYLSTERALGIVYRMMLRRDYESAKAATQCLSDLSQQLMNSIGQEQARYGH